MTVSTTFGGRFARRVRARRWSRVRLLLVTSGVLAVGAAAVWVVMFSTVLGVRSVSVVGVGRLSADQVARAAAIEPGTPLARLDTARVVRRVSALPAVGRASVSRRWPRAVEVTVVERVPAAVRARGSSWQLVDASGVGFDLVGRRPAGLPTVSAPDDAGAPALAAALRVLASLPPAVRGQVAEVRAAGPEQVRLQLSRHRTVIWGRSERDARKASVLAALMTRKARVYDVSAPDAPTTRK